uniref:Dbuz\CG14609b-PA n=1 Tax=Drosophila buzzatii TaxID=7264 RepID=Q4VIV5_DROBU|nr:Dbuz\CG14609b-PA [Drosophila buzzatii]
MAACSLEKTLPRRCRQPLRDDMAPKPVHPRAIRFHGLFAESLVRQHFIVDDRWSPDSLCCQFSGMTDFLARYAIFKRHEIRANRQRAVKESKLLKLQCRNGGAKLRNIVTINNTNEVRNLLIAYKDMQRLYQKMPIHLVSDNINQRTFVMRKERDRLAYRLSQLKDVYRQKLKHRSMLENRIKYQNEYVQEEEVKSRDFMKKIDNSQVRLKAIKTINIAYKKMVQVLSNDAIFYEPILRSLDGDMEDQANFIKHILYLGMPAIAKFKELNLEYRQLEYKSRKNIQKQQSMLESLQTKTSNTNDLFKRQKTIRKVGEVIIQKPYVRETHNMLLLKNVMKVIEKVIRDLKFGTLCSQASEIYPRMRIAIERNRRMLRFAEFEGQGRYNLEDKVTYAMVMKNILANNLGNEEIQRLQRIKQLKRDLAQAEELERSTLNCIKARAHAFIMLRWALWNFHGLLQNVGYIPKILRQTYPNSYLSLPLLKFEMLTMYSHAPDIFPVDIDDLMHLLKRKIFQLTKAYNPGMEPNIPQSKEKYHSDYMDTCELIQYPLEEQEQTLAVNEVSFNEKSSLHIFSRKQIKVLSAKVLDQAFKILYT